ncbi:MAG: AMP-binding protein [Rubrivivax sp.]
MTLPLLGPRDLAAPLAWVGGQPISGERFVAEAAALAATLPAQGPAVNLCQDRYRFALGLAAALQRGHASLMPPNALPETLRRLEHRGAVPYALVDADQVDAAGLQRVTVRRIADAPAAAVPQLDAALDAVVLLTSGSTGTPQPHRKPWGPLVRNIGAEAERLAQMTGRASLVGLTVVATVPPQHSYGFESSVLLALLGGAAFEASRPFYPADIVAALERVPRPRALVTTPFHLKTLLAAGIALPPVDLLLSATAPLSPQLAAEAEARLDGALIEIYGCTEAGQVASRRTTEGETWLALGELRLWREGAGDGERFLVQGGHVELPTALADVLELHDAQRFRLLGRAGDLIHVAGKRSSLAHLNFQLNRVPGVVDGAFWLPDEPLDGVVRPVAFVVAPGLSAREVIAGLRQTVEAAFVPRRVVMLDALPREATGKITAGTLRALAAEHLAPEGDDQVTLAAEHPAFDGHFPGQPIAPGVLLLSLVMRALDRRPALRARVGPTPVLDGVKFLGAVAPGATLRIALTARSRGVDVEVFDGDRVALRGRLLPGAAAP